MIDALIRIAIARRWIILFLVLAVAAAGVWNYQRLPTMRTGHHERPGANQYAGGGLFAA